MTNTTKPKPFRKQENTPLPTNLPAPTSTPSYLRKRRGQGWGEEQAETVNHLFLHCKWTNQLWRIFSSLRKSTWVKPRNIVQLLNCWINVGNTTIKEERWKIVPACIWWTVWKERNQRCFEGKKNNFQNFKMNCIALYYFWCKQKVLVQAKELLDAMPVTLNDILLHGKARKMITESSRLCGRIIPPDTPVLDTIYSMHT
ncbi:hypothetical protein H5410_055266 [Solanum commersonii]|uniref:Uncharacterized protein n=1 Tax=Solanum commersonii TaxID=4109 RepID=A0A9J5WIU3_SOLCO|nr:hypothetical protein H5410_055266 [Solanum commersonii]